MPKIKPKTYNYGTGPHYVSDRYFVIEEIMNKHPVISALDKPIRLSIQALAYLEYCKLKKDETEKLLSTYGHSPVDKEVLTVHLQFDDDTLKDLIDSAWENHVKIFKKEVDAYREELILDVKAAIKSDINFHLHWKNHLKTAIITGIIAGILSPAAIEVIRLLLNMAGQRP